MTLSEAAVLLMNPELRMVRRWVTNQNSELVPSNWPHDGPTPTLNELAWLKNQNL